MTTKTRRSGQRGKSIDERIAYALGHRVRIEILRRLLSEGAQTADAIAAVVGESRQNVHHHLKELLDAGAIEIAKVEKKRNADLHYYCALEQGRFDRDALESMTLEQRQEIAGWIVQHSSAEVMAALATGKLSDDPRFCLMWNWLHSSTHRDARSCSKNKSSSGRGSKKSRLTRSAAAPSRANRRPRTSFLRGGFERAEIAPLPSADADKSADSF